MLKTKNEPNLSAGVQPGQVGLVRVSKRFKKQTLSRRSYRTLKTSLVRRLLSRENQAEAHGYVQALDNVSIDIPPGRSVGLIGRNGSGKSTALKLIAGIYQPDSGGISVNGKVSALIELGAGFHPDFTGRENVYLGGVMYGLSRRQIDERFNQIVSYAELEDCIDDPIRTYSSGMYMRLGFSLAVHTEPDILLIDEVLAVGDATFIQRCHDTISDFRRRGKTMIFVTHDLASVARWCDEAIWLDKGKVLEQGDPERVIDGYLSFVEGIGERQLDELNASNRSESDNSRWGNREVEILDVRMVDATGSGRWLYDTDEPLSIEVDYRVNVPKADLVFGLGFIRADGVPAFGTNTDIDKIDVPISACSGLGTYIVVIERLGLAPDSYFLDVAAHAADGAPFDYHHRMYKFSVRSDRASQGICSPSRHWEFRASGEG